ncbi:MAG: ankyrin repeat domain-containing protein, partial [Campylobacteraceae bacterium]|nr:ankyrin repeat domain-containing protein [Campylobacteraceae bacterium]
MQFNKLFNFNNDIEKLIEKGNINKIEKYLKKNNIDFQANIEHFFNLAIASENSNFLEYLVSLNLKFPESIDNLSLLSFALSKNANLDIIKYIVSNDNFSNTYDYGLTPFEIALQMNYPYELFKYLIDNNILDTSSSNLPLEHQIIDNETLDEELRGAIFIYLLENVERDLNYDIQNTDPLIVKAYNKEDLTLVYLFLLYGAKIKYIHSVYEDLFDKEGMSYISDFLLENQPKEDYKYFIEFLTFENIKTFISSLDNTKHMKLILHICNNTLITDTQKAELISLCLEKGSDINEVNDDAEGLTPLQFMCKNFVFGKNIQLVEFFINNGAKFNHNNKQPLESCINGNELYLIKYLINSGVDINELNFEGHGAINGFIDTTYLNTLELKVTMLETLIDLGLNINQKVEGIDNDEYAKTTLFDILSLDKDNHEFLEYILKNHPELEIGNEMSMIFNRELSDEICKLVIDKNPTFECENFFEKEFGKETFYYSAQFLDMAIHWKRKELADYLIDNYPQMRGYNENISLISHAYNRNFPVSFIKKLIAKDSNINREYKRKDKFNITITETSLIRVLRYTSKEEEFDECYELIDFMLDNNADANISLKKYNIPDYYLNEEGVLMFAVSRAENLNTKLFDLLIDKGNVDPNKPVSNLMQTQSQSLLHSIDIDDDVKYAYLKYFHEKCGLNLEIMDRKGYNLFLTTTSNCLPKCMQFLIDLGANVHIIGGSDNSPAIHKAISNYHFVDKTKRAQTVKVLIDAGVDLEQFDSEQLTPLMSASKYGCFEALVTLLENGANPNNKNETNCNAANVLITYDYKETEHFYSYDDKENIEENKSKILAVLKDYGCDLNNVPLDGSTILNNAIGYNLKTIFNTLLQL